MNDYIKTIVEYCKPLNYALFSGDMIEINNKTNEGDFPCFILETDYAVDFIKAGTGYKRVFNIVVGILDKSQLEDIDEDREASFIHSINAFETFLMNLEKVRFNENTLTFGTEGIAVVDSINTAKIVRIKNKFSTNTDGILATSLSITFYQNFNKCLNKLKYDSN